jgi:hypothetical protein
MFLVLRKIAEIITRQFDGPVYVEIIFGIGFIMFFVAIIEWLIVRQALEFIIPMFCGVWFGSLTA